MTSKPRLLLAILALLLAALPAAVWLAGRSPSAGTGKPATGDGMALPTGGLAANALELAPADEERSMVGELRLAPAENFSLDDVVWIEGHVSLPVEAAGEQALHVVAAAIDGERRLRAANVTRLLSALAERGDSFPVARRPIETDGSFRVPLPQGTRSAILRLDGRYLHFNPPVVLRLGRDRPPPLELTAQVGCWLTARLQLPANLPADVDPSALVGIEVFLSGWSSNAGPGFESSAAINAALGFELRGIPARTSASVGFDPIQFVSVRKDNLHLAAGERTELVVELDLGASVSGNVLDSEGRALAGARVRARAAGTQTPERSSISNARGGFLLQGLPAGDVSLTANLGGWLAAESTLNGLRTGEHRVGVVLTLNAGQRVSGRVIWPDGDPAITATVRIASGKNRSGRWQADLATVQTDPRGAFSIGGLGQGPFVVRAIAPLSGPGAPESAGGEGLAQLWKASARGVRPGDTLVLELAEPLDLRGHVLDDLGNPVREFSISVQEQALDAAPRAFVESVSQSFKDEHGAFAVSGLSAGAWTLRVSAPGFSDANSAVRLPAHELQTVTLQRAAQLAGRVEDAGGRPIAAADVHALRAQGIDRWHNVSGHTDEQGRFLLEDLAPGSIEVSADADGFAPSPREAFMLAAGESREDVRIVLGRGGRLEGMIYGSDGRGEAGRQIMIQNFASATASGSRVTSEADGRFLALNLTPGSYQVMAVPRPEQYSRTQSGDDPVEWLSELKMTSIEIVENQTTEVVLGAPPRAPVHLFGNVSRGGVPLARCTVMAVVEGSSILDSMKFSSSDESGAYSLTLDAAGAYTLLVGSNLGSGESVELSLTAPERSEMRYDIELPFASVAGTVWSPEGEPVVGAQLRLLRDGATTSFNSMHGGPDATTDEEGRYLFESLEAGTYTLRAAPVGSLLAARVRSGIQVGSDQAVTGIDLTLSRGGTLVGRVLDSTGAPVSGATIFVRDALGRVLDPVSECSTDGNGHFVCEGVPEETITVSARRDQNVSPESAPVAVPRDGRAEVELTLAPGTLLRVLLEDENGGGVRAHVRVVDAAGRDWAGMLGSQALDVLLTEGFSPSQQRVGPLPPGEYTVWAKDEHGNSAKKPLDLEGQAQRRVTLRLVP